MKNFELIYTNSKFKKSKLPLPENLKASEVLIEPLRVGICGSDLYDLETYTNSELRLGHEWIGKVIDSNSSKYSPGDLVTSTVVFGCGECRACKSGLENNCIKGDRLGGGLSALRSHITLNEKFLLKLKNDDLDTGVLLEVASVAEQAYSKLLSMCLTINSKVLIFGAGPIGVMCALKLEKEGVDYKLLEIDKYRYQLCKQLGLKVELSGFELLNKESFMAYNYIIDCSGDGNGKSGFWKYMFHFCNYGAKVLIVGKYIKPIEIESVAYNNRDLTISWMRGVPIKTYEKTIEEWSEYLQKYSSAIISHVFKIDDVQEAFDIALKRKDTMKVVIEL